MAGMDLTDTVGMLFLTAIITMGLWGASTVQLYYYFDNFSKDPRTFKAYVLTIWLLDTIHQALITADTYIIFVRHFGDFAYLTVHVQIRAWGVLCAAFVSIMVQSVFAFRIWRLSKHNVILNLVIAVLILAQFAVQMVCFGIDIKPAQYDNMDRLLPITKATNSLIAVTDCTIAGALVWLFWSSRTGFQHTDKVLSRLIVFVVSTGLATAMSAVLALILSLAYPSAYYYVFFHINIMRLYVNSLFAMLNYRSTLSNALSSNKSSDGSMQLNSLRSCRLFKHRSNFSKQISPYPPTFNISVATETIVDDAEKAIQTSRSDVNREHVENAYPSGFGFGSKPDELTIDVAPKVVVR